MENREERLALGALAMIDQLIVPDGTRTPTLDEVRAVVDEWSPLYEQRGS